MRVSGALDGKTTLHISKQHFALGVFLQALDDGLVDCVLGDFTGHAGLLFLKNKNKLESFPILLTS